MIYAVKFTPAKFKDMDSATLSDARNITKKMQLDISLDRRGICDLIQALTSAVQSDGASVCVFDGTINIQRTREANEEED